MHTDDGDHDDYCNDDDDDDDDDDDNTKTSMMMTMMTMIMMMIIRKHRRRDVVQAHVDNSSCVIAYTNATSHVALPPRNRKFVRRPSDGLIYDPEVRIRALTGRVLFPSKNRSVEEAEALLRHAQGHVSRCRRSRAQWRERRLVNYATVHTNNIPGESGERGQESQQQQQQQQQQKQQGLQLQNGAEAAEAAAAEAAAAAAP